MQDKLYLFALIVLFAGILCVMVKLFVFKFMCRIFWETYFETENRVLRNKQGREE